MIQPRPDKKFDERKTPMDEGLLIHSSPAGVMDGNGDGCPKSHKQLDKNMLSHLLYSVVWIINKDRIYGGH